MSNQTIQLVLSINAGEETDAEEMEALTQQLYRDLLELEDVESVDLVRAGKQPERAKVSDPISWGTVLVTSLAAGGVITTLINAIQSWLTRNERRSITVEIDGDKLQITGISSKEQQQIINAWINNHTKS